MHLEGPFGRTKHHPPDYRGLQRERQGSTGGFGDVDGVRFNPRRYVRVCLGDLRPFANAWLLGICFWGEGR